LFSDGAKHGTDAGRLRGGDTEQPFKAPLFREEFQRPANGFVRREFTRGASSPQKV
jgi:hypothetical protein